MKKRKYIEIMDTVINAYSDERVREYIDEVKRDGLSEHGFARLAVALGILIAHGRRGDQKEIFAEMMDICCAQIPTALQKHCNVGNDFAVREIVSCLLLLEEKRVFPKEKTDEWRELLKKIDPYTCYRVIASDPPARIGNWAAFGAASEQARKYAGIGCEDRFIDNQIASQLFSFDENGMYRDPGSPMLYDIVTRGVLSTALYYGYDGPHKEQLEQLLEMGGRQTLYMQSVTGELAYGGRSNQFLHNEAWIAALCEYEACRYKQRGELILAGQFKSAAKLAVNKLTQYLDGEQMYHIKNAYPNDSQFGCEGYGYFNKYMVSIASLIYLAYLFADDSIDPVPCPAEAENYIHRTSDYFHKIFCKFGEYFVQYETNANFHYDANGLGRVHRKGAPSMICLSVPCAKKPGYHIDLENPSDLSICGGVCINGIDMFGCEAGTEYQLDDQSVSEYEAKLEWSCKLTDGHEYKEYCTVSADGVHLKFKSDGELCCRLPVFAWDGMHQSCVEASENRIIVSFDGWQCCYETDGVIMDGEAIYANRNGHYRAFTAKKRGELNLRISIYPAVTE